MMIKTPAFTLLYNNQNATYDIAKDLIEASFTDHLTDQSDELEITLADDERKWLGAWYPTKGATLAFAIGFEGETLLNCGTFEIDEITINDSPNTVQIRALSAGISAGSRSVKHVAFDNKTLDTIIGTVASSLGYSIEGKIEPLLIERVTQKETGLTFIKRLAHEYGYAVKIKERRLIFTHIEALKSAASIATIDRLDVMRGWSVRDQIRTVKQDASVTKHNPKTRQTIKGKAKAPSKSKHHKKGKVKKPKPPLTVYGLKDGKVVKVN